MSPLMSRVLTGVNATTYCISTALAFWIIERAGRRFLMLSGLGLQGFAYIMVAIAVALLASAPQQVRQYPVYCAVSCWLTRCSGERSPLHSSSSTMRPLVVHGEWFPGFTRPKSIHWR